MTTTRHHRILTVTLTALATFAACTSNTDHQDTATPTTANVGTGTSTSTSPQPESIPGAFTTQQEPPALQFILEMRPGFSVLLARQEESLDAHLADPDAIAELVDWATADRLIPQTGPYDTILAGGLVSGQGGSPNVAPLPTQGPSTGCSEHWMSVIDLDGNEITRFAPGICIGQFPEIARPRLTESISFLAVLRDWVAIDGVLLTHHLTGSQRDNPEWVWPEPAALLDRSTYQVPPGHTMPLLPDPDDRLSFWSGAGWEFEGGPSMQVASRICLTVYVDAGDPGPDGTVTFDLDVRDADDQPIDVELSVPAEASPHTLTAFPLTPLPIDEPTTITLHANDGTIDTWAPAARGC